MMINVLLAGGAQGGQMDLLSMAPLVLVMVLMFWFMNRSTKKKEREAREIREAIEVGDEVVSIGGIVGTIVKIEEETILVESGSDRSKLRLKKEAIGTNNTAIERATKEKEQAKEAAMTAKAEKKKK